jgi:hypothetical protein
MTGELYQLDVDLGQRENLYEAQSTRVQAMLEELRRIYDRRP